MSKEERYTYHCDQYDYIEIIYDNEECEEIDSMKMAEKRLNRQQDKIADLEAKLAESENRVKDLEFRNKNLEHSLNVAPNANAGQRARIVELREINHKLKQQLAEKEAEIKELNHKLNVEQPCLLMNYQDMIEKLKARIEQASQDKILFAVERLEKVKTDISLYNKEHCFLSTEIDTCNKSVEIIDNQIKQLKEMKWYENISI